MDQQDRELYGLQILRAIAASGVVIRHTLDMSDGSEAGRFSPAWMTTFGAAGVDLFFVISGFIMVYVSFPPGRAAETPGRFMIKRARRIFPLYWICSAGILAISLVGFLKHKNIGEFSIFNSIFLLPGDKLIFVAWTLSYEMYFYVAFAICLIFGKLIQTSISTVLLMICGIVLGRWIQDSSFSEFISSPIVLEFCFGIAIALLFISRSKWEYPPALGALGFFLIIISPVFVSHPGDTAILRVIAWGLPATLIVGAFLKTKRPRSKAGRGVILLGDASYAIYLTHIFVMLGYGWLIKATFVGGVSQISFAPMIICLCLIVGVLTHLFVEKPILELLRKVTILQRRPPPLEAGSLPR
ncbi:acyltransferase family protein [Mesorhizobium sangaii]|uniref:Peptidoglycan/LPS O-acetylase OafA/YrhL n=1 Tax=Mesorhizobium sangaii TaxID=505389 RepID=A0A841PCU9_9HYPH|nr:acyltransferase [Mesorhizobium sangaii]MBB6408680.1 peptidoglycan/LPS O-acetylase OafA/YrhL [Mesorhizobium sangaii]